MKHARLLLLALCMTSGMAANAQSFSTDPKVNRCYQKLHACFQTGDLTTIFPFDPLNVAACEQKCANIPVTNACSVTECTDRCAVAFGLLPAPCE